MNQKNDFYVYMYLREDGTPYYVGKGRRNRVYSKTGRRVHTPKDKSRIVFYKQNLTEEDAFKHEIELIAFYGRKDLGTGILHNLTDGGEGTSGIIISEETKRKLRNRIFTEETRKKLSERAKVRTYSEETRRKISEANRRRVYSEETRRKHRELAISRVRVYSEETRRKINEAISEAKKGRPRKSFSEEHRRKIGEAHRGRVRSEETRRKISEAKKEYDRKKRLEKLSSVGTGLEKFFG